MLRGNINAPSLAYRIFNMSYNSVNTNLTILIIDEVKLLSNKYGKHLLAPAFHVKYSVFSWSMLL